MQRERQVWVVGWSDRAIANIMCVQYVLLAWLEIGIVTEAKRSVNVKETKSVKREVHA